MTTSIKDFIAAKKLPKWLTSHEHFKSVEKINKVFPRIGLQNYSEPCHLAGNFARPHAKTLIMAIQREFKLAFEVFEKSNHYDHMNLIEQIDSLIVDDIDSLIREKKGKISLQLPKDIIIDEAIKFKQNGDLLTTYAICRQEFSGSGHTIPNLTKLPGHKDFDVNNFSTNKTSIVFASDGIDGLWDIATMSMRGIKSCIRWQGGHKLTLIGSLLDPFTGVIYLTSGKQEKYGSRMIKRCVVRFIINADNNKPYLLIDKMYPSLNEEVLNQFVASIRTHTNNAFAIYYGPDTDPELLDKSYIPKTAITKVLSDKTLPYRDTKLPVGKGPSKISERRTSNIKIKEHNLAVRLKKSIVYQSCVAIINQLQEEQVKRSLLGADFLYLKDNYATDLVSKLSIACNKINPDVSSDDWIKQLCYHYFANKKTDQQIN